MVRPRRSRTRVPARPGHSLAELIVAVVFLGAALGGVGASTWLGARWAEAALARQRALRTAAAALDSVLADSTAVDGTAARNGLTVGWSVDAGAPTVVRVNVVTGSGDTLATLEDRRLDPSPQVLPDAF